MELRDLPALSGLSDSQIENFKAAMRAVEIGAGQTVFTKGRLANAMFFFGSGKLRVHADNQDLAELSAPCVVGEMELLSGGAPAASVTAVETCTGFAIDYDDLRRRLEAGDVASLTIVYNIAQVVARRLAAMDTRVVEILGGKWETAKKDLQNLRAKLFEEWS